jgi:hypothetical protein
MNSKSRMLAYNTRHAMLRVSLASKERAPSINLYMFFHCVCTSYPVPRKSLRTAGAQSVMSSKNVHKQANKGRMLCWYSDQVNAKE